MIEQKQISGSSVGLQCGSSQLRKCQKWSMIPHPTLDS